MSEKTLEELLGEIAQNTAPEEKAPTERGRTFLQGITFGTADELEAYIRSIGSEREYEDLVNEIRGNLDSYKQARPLEAAGAEIAGAAAPAVIATILTGGGALPAIATRLPLLNNLIGRVTGRLLGTKGTSSISSSHRLTSSPMDVPKALISNSLDLITLQLKIRVGDKSLRRVIQVSEIDGVDERTGQIKTHEIFKWNPKTDNHDYMGDSVIFRKLKERDGDTEEKINYELTKRRLALEWMVRNDIRDHKEVSANVMDYYADPERYYERKRLEVQI